MEFGLVEWYLLAINVLGAVVGALNSKVKSKKPEGKSDIVPMIISILGGSVGTLISIAIFDRKSEKGNMMSRVTILCVFVLQIVAYLVFKGFVARRFSFAFWTLFVEHPWTLIYLLLINIVTYIMYAVDKKAAIKGKNRVKIVVLLGLAFIGGTPGALIGMYTLRHKTEKNYFYIGVPMMLFTQVVVLFYLANASF